MLDEEWRRPAPDPMRNGLAANPAIPEHLLLRLITDHGPVVVEGLARRAHLPGPALAAMLDHPAPQVRAAVAENRSVDPAVRLGLLRDPHFVVRTRAAEQPDLAIPEPDLIELLGRIEWFAENGLMTQPELLGDVQFIVSRERRLLGVMARHPKEKYRLIACEFGDILDEPLQKALLADPSPAVRTAVARRLAEDTRPRTVDEWKGEKGRGRRYMLYGPLSPELIDFVLASDDPDNLTALAGNRRLSAAVVETLVAHPDARVRQQTADRHDLTNDQVARLVADPDPQVRAHASVHPALTEEQRAAIDLVLDEQEWADIVRRPAPGQAEAWARSVNPLLRRWAARDPNLPADLVASLAQDQDEVVRKKLAHHHPGASGELLLRTYLGGGDIDRRRLRTRPAFPTAGLARHAGAADPELRVLATLDPAVDPELVAVLLTDPDEQARLAAPGCPRLPVPRLVALLADTELGEFAAANPALPVAEMERLVSAERSG